MLSVHLQVQNPLQVVLIVEIMDENSTYINRNVQKDRFISRCCIIMFFTAMTP